jgi:DNA-binding transcriptional ArsR family regulator
MTTPESTPSPRRSRQYRSPRRAPEIDKYVDTFLDAVCDTSRRYILELLATPSGEGDSNQPEWRSGDIARALGLSPATTSEHLHILAENGLVASRRDANVVYYRLSNEKLVLAFHTLVDALDNDYITRQSGDAN